jgi:hypothetical protein
MSKGIRKANFLKLSGYYSVTEQIQMQPYNIQFRAEHQS